MMCSQGIAKMTQLSGPSLKRFLYLSTQSYRQCAQTFSTATESHKVTLLAKQCVCRHGIKLDSSTSVFMKQTRHMAGHAHWRNVAPTKAAENKKYETLVRTEIVKMRAAIKAGGTDLKSNKTLATIMEVMMKKGIPKADVQKYYDNCTRKSATFDTHYLVVRGPQGAMFVVEVYTDNLPLLKKDLKTSLKKLLVEVMERAVFNVWFDQKGVVIVPVTKEMSVTNLDPYVEIALETGAEDVILTPNEQTEDPDQYVLKFHCDPMSVSRVAKDIDENHCLTVSSSQVELLPTSWAILNSQEDIELCNKVVDKLNTHDDVVKVFDNISLPED